MPIIEVRNLTKVYRLGALTGIKQSLLHAKARLLGGPSPQRPLFKALDDVSFSIEPGEVVGIIGPNGAGKSTLLKLLARISTPTSGSLSIIGRMAPLIEVGAGFIPDFTGRENVYLNGTILGMSSKEIKNKFDEIVDFAEVAEFIDTPVKRYSSGMQVKLAFAVASSVDAEILIIDEVLAVGDLAFQRKCFDRMEDLIKRQRRTVLVVSHNLRQIARMCSRVVLLREGKITRDGDPQDVCNAFYEYNNQKIRKTYTTAAARVPRQNDIFQLNYIGLVDEHGAELAKIQSGEPLRVRLSIHLARPLTGAEIVVGTHTTDFIYLTANSTSEVEGPLDLSAGSHQLECIIHHFPFRSGAYALRLAVFDSYRTAVFAEENLKIFEVAHPRETQLPAYRLVDLPAEWRVDTIAHESVAAVQ